MFTLHTNKGGAYTEHVQSPLFWACADATLSMCRHANEGKSSDLHDWQYWRHNHKLTSFGFKENYQLVKLD